MIKTLIAFLLIAVQLHSQTTIISSKFPEIDTSRFYSVPVAWNMVTKQTIYQIFPKLNQQDGWIYFSTGDTSLRLRPYWQPAPNSRRGLDGYKGVIVDDPFKPEYDISWDTTPHSTQRFITLDDGGTLTSTTVLPKKHFTKIKRKAKLRR